MYVAEQSFKLILHMSNKHSNCLDLYKTGGNAM